MRRLETVRTTCVINTATTLLTVPGGEKFEITDISVSSDFVNLYAWLFWINDGAHNWPVDEINAQSGQGYAHRQFAGVVLHAGETLVADAVTGAGHPNKDAVVCYVRVSPD